MKNILKTLALGLGIMLVTTSCVDDLNTEPLNEQDINAANAFDTEEGYSQFLAKLYGSLTLTGQQGEYGKPEIPAEDEGTTSFLRMYWSAQEVSTDEAVTGWNDPGLSDYQEHTWSDNNGYLQLLYQRIFINIAYCNEFLRAVDNNIGEMDEDFKAEVTVYRAEAQLLRAMFYYFAMDLWGNVPFVLPEDGVGAFQPEMIQREALFDHIEAEILEALPNLKDPRQNVYARADKAVAWTLLAKMYLNAEVYRGENRYNDCIKYCDEIINSGQYNLIDNYRNLFLADNHQYRSEIIFPIAEDGNNTRNYGGMTFIIHAQVGGTMDADNDYGIPSGGWSGNRPSTSFVERSFEDVTGATDKRAIFHTSGQSSLEITDPFMFNQGYLTGKFKNVSSKGIKGKNGTFVDTDFPMFRLADIYLMYAEATLRGGAGDRGRALQYVNEIRSRAYEDASGNISDAELTLDFLLDERGRELYWECHRRTDLVRFGEFTDGKLVWDWKGGIQEGIPTASFRDIFPIPAFDLGLNPNLKQNPNY
ncbi:RagB/SusD family nutrient uptake outer membrane protein [Limibacter armeniacum]|uniref:RagB/SusD family nutrient uptake outer membrane protein n=1 Tax=Limibacter armeniacum TaxID=466084 RepID=UPI002FE57443